MTVSVFSERTRRYHLDVVEDIDRLTHFIGEMDLSAFVADEKTILAVERLFQRITEAVVRIGADDMALVAPTMPVNEIRAFGNRLRHDYGNIDPALMLQIAREDLPGLRAAAAAALSR